MSFCTNGWVGAGDQGTIDAVNMRVPANFYTSTIPNNTIAAWFRDMDVNFPQEQGIYATVGTDVFIPMGQCCW
ncbi:MAG: hypothetical protein IPL22_16750 [Bacteroidetes bacterium]|nr:hypothetical protein [Bacteroidota bacterium]